jgi:hypothetical protein
VEGLEGLELAGQADPHLPAGRVGVGEVEDDNGAAVLGADLGHLVDEGVADLAGWQVQVGLAPVGDRAEDLPEGGLLADHDQLVGLGGDEADRDGLGGQVLDIGDLNVDADVDEGEHVAGLPAADGGGGVALVDDLVERQVAEPAGGLGGVLGQPEPVVVGVAVGPAVWLGAAQHHVVDAAEVDQATAEAELLDGGCEPGAVAVIGRSVQPERITLLR